MRKAHHKPIFCLLLWLFIFQLQACNSTLPQQPSKPLAPRETETPAQIDKEVITPTESKKDSIAPDYVESMLKFLEEQDIICQKCLSSDMKNYVYWHDEDPKLYVYNSESEETFIIDPVGQGYGIENATFISWSPDGQKMLIATDDSGHFKHYDPQNILLIYTINEYLPAVFVPSDIDDRYMLVSLFPTSDVPVGLYKAIWSGDSNHIAVLYNDYQEIFIIDIEGNIEETIDIAYYVETNKLNPFIDLVGWAANSMEIFIISEKDRSRINVNQSSTFPTLQKINIISGEFVNIEVPLNQSYVDYSYWFNTGFNQGRCFLYHYQGEYEYYLHYYCVDDNVMFFSFSQKDSPYEVFVSPDDNYMMIKQKTSYLLYNNSGNEFVATLRYQGIVWGWYEPIGGFLIINYGHEKGESFYQVVKPELFVDQ